MRFLSTSYSAWLALLGAVLMWGGIAYGLWAINSAQASREQKIVEAEQLAIQQSAALRLHALARDTKEQREKLEKVARMDIVEILDAIEGLARDAKVPVEIGQAHSEPGSAASPVHAAFFVIQIQGSFAQIFHTVSLLEAIPIPSSVSELDFERLP
ncbi:hypothetical protein HY478_00135, partial [Candidatus Uhrbacteria bacterium]|nr:hypothetical protein [Candidatus Uhrbacteria bacterium]